MLSRGNMENKDGRRYCAGCRYFFGNYEACRMGMEALERSRWIPCSERLPEPPEEGGPRNG